MRILFLIDPLERLDLAGDTSYALMLECADRGHELFTCQPGHLGLEHDQAVAAAVPTAVTRADTPAAAFSLGEREPLPLSAFGAVVIRQDPPVDVDYLHATYILDRARGQTLLVNDPRGLRELNEHLAVLAFPELTPPTIVTRDKDRVRAFLAEQGGQIVVKPIDGFAGRGIFLLRTGDPNLSSLIETATRDGSAWTMAQRYLPEASAGDKRILLAGGEPMGAVLRVPPKDEIRDNLHVGGTAQAAEVTEGDRAIIAALAPTLAEHGLLFVGIDVIGGQLTEINITSPTGIRHMDATSGGNHAAPLIDLIERRAPARH